MQHGLNLQELLSQAKGLETLPETAAGHKQKPVDDFGYKPSAAKTKRDIEADKILAPIQREIFMQERAKIEEEQKQEALKEVAEFTIPSSDQLASMSHMSLIGLRSKATTEEEQSKLAPYEHRAFAREYIEEKPEAALVMPGMIMAYNVLRKAGVLKGRSDPNAKHIIEGLKGYVEGVGRTGRNIWKELNTFPDPDEVWEESKKNGADLKEKLTGKD